MCWTVAASRDFCSANGNIQGTEREEGREREYWWKEKRGTGRLLSSLSAGGGVLFSVGLQYLNVPPSGSSGIEAAEWKNPCSSCGF